MLSITCLRHLFPNTEPVSSRGIVSRSWWRIRKIFCFKSEGNLVHLLSPRELYRYQGRRSSDPLKLPVSIFHKLIVPPKEGFSLPTVIAPIHPNESKHFPLYCKVQHVQPTYRIREGTWTSGIQRTTYKNGNTARVAIKICCDEAEPPHQHTLIVALNKVCILYATDIHAQTLELTRVKLF